MNKIPVIKIIEGKSDLYVSRKVLKYIRSFTEKTKNAYVNKVVKTLDNIARITGFNPMKSPAVRDEGDGVLRIGEKLKRIIGFNTTVKKRFDFIAVDCFDKPDSRRSKDQSKKYKRATKIKKDAAWKVVTKEEYL